MAIAGGENLRTRYEFKPYLTQRAYDIVQPDIMHCGGITEMQRICAMANACGIQVNPHVWGSPVMIAATLHLAVASGNREGEAVNTGNLGLVRHALGDLDGSPGGEIAVVTVQAESIQGQVLQGHAPPPTTPPGGGGPRGGPARRRRWRR